MSHWPRKGCLEHDRRFKKRWTNEIDARKDRKTDFLKLLKDDFDTVVWRAVPWSEDFIRVEADRLELSVVAHTEEEVLKTRVVVANQGKDRAICQAILRRETTLGGTGKTSC